MTGTTIGALRPIDAIMAIVTSSGRSNAATLHQMRVAMTVIATPCTVEGGWVYIDDSPYGAEIQRFLETGEIFEGDQP